MQSYPNQSANSKGEYAPRPNANEFADITNDSYGIKSGTVGMGAAAGTAL